MRYKRGNLAITLRSDLLGGNLCSRKNIVTVQGSQVVDSQSLAKAKKNDPEYKPISRTKYTY
jgi:hypothetical protein